MKVVSDSCKCGACTKKYYCSDYAMVVSLQRLAGKYFSHGSKGIQIVFQVEECKNRETRAGKGRGVDK